MAARSEAEAKGFVFQKPRPLGGVIHSAPVQRNLLPLGNLKGLSFSFFYRFVLRVSR